MLCNTAFAVVHATFIYPNELITNYDPIKDPTYSYYKKLPRLSQRMIRSDVYAPALGKVMGILNCSDPPWKIVRTELWAVRPKLNHLE